MVKEVSLDSLEVIGKLGANPTKGNKIGYDPTAWQEPIPEKRNLEKLHWVLISKEVIGKNKTYEDQQKLAKEKNIPGANISGLIDTALSVFMEYVRSGERNFMWDSAKNNYNWVRVNEQTRGLRICLGFAPSGLGIDSSSDLACDYFGLARARKSFGL